MKTHQHYYLKDGKIWKGNTPLPLKEKFKICMYRTFEEYYDSWIKLLQPCEISESDLEKIKEFILKDNTIMVFNNPIDITYLITDANGVVTFKQPNKPRVFGGKDDIRFWSDKPIQEGHPDFK